MQFELTFACYDLSDYDKREDVKKLIEKYSPLPDLLEKEGVKERFDKELDALGWYYYFSKRTPSSEESFEEGEFPQMQVTVIPIIKQRSHK